MTLELTRHQFSVDDYDRLAATGVLGDDDRVELIEGEILEMSPLGDKHVIPDRVIEVYRDPTPDVFIVVDSILG